MLFRPHIKALLITPIVLLIVGGALLLREGNDEWRSVRSSVMPQFMRISNKDVLPLAHRDFSKDLDIGFVIDKEKSYDFIMEKQLEEWHINEETLYKTAMANLERRSADIPMSLSTAEETGEHYIIIETGDGYDAVLLLSSTVRKKAREYLGDSFVAAVPVRDFLVMWQTDFSLQDAFINEVQTTYNDGELYKLSSNIFAVSPQGIQLVEVHPLER